MIQLRSCRGKTTAEYLDELSGITGSLGKSSAKLGPGNDAKSAEIFTATLENFAWRRVSGVQVESLRVPSGV